MPKSCSRGLVYITHDCPNLGERKVRELKVELEPENTKGCHDSSLETCTGGKKKGSEKRENIDIV